MRLELLSIVLALPAISFAQKKIVLSNDDGWATANIRALYQALTEEGHNVRPTTLLKSKSTMGRVESNLPLIGLRTRLSSRASQGGLTSLVDPDKQEGLWRARSHSFATS